jgi:CRISPR-associated protein (TIGR03986 family)
MEKSKSELIEIAKAFIIKSPAGKSVGRVDDDLANELFDNYGMTDEGLTDQIIAEARRQLVPAAQPKPTHSKPRGNLKHTKRNLANEALITAPYRFIDLPDTVVAPEPGHSADHATPLPDGYCGSIEVSWTAESPFLIGGTKAAHASDNDAVQAMRLGDNGPYVIPGASIKGLLRSACEIVAYGKLGAANLHHRYGLRDFQHPYYVEESGVSKVDQVKAGFLRVQGDLWTITPAKSWAQVRIPDSDNNAGWSGTSLLEKYRKLGMVKNDVIDFSVTHEFGPYDEESLNLRPGGTPGVYVVSDKLPGSGKKKYEYAIFRDDDAVARPIDADRVAIFERMYSTPNKNKTDPIGSWKILKPIAEQSEIPVFYIGSLEAGQQANLAFGMTRLFKIPHKQSVGQILANQKQHAPKGKFINGELDSYVADFVENLFGYVVEPSDLMIVEGKTSTKPSAVALKGRLAFGFAALDKDTPATTTKTQKLIQMTPRASFAPFYLRGNGEKDYSASQVKLAGRKAYFPRYPRPQMDEAVTAIAKLVDRQIEHAKGPNGKGKVPSEEAFSKLSFLVPKQADKFLRFTGEVRFHNVTAAELGALLFALTHGGDTTNPYRFMLGRAKPFGAGQMKISAIALNARPNNGTTPAVADGEELASADGKTGWCKAGSHSLQPYLAAFTAYMKTMVPNYPAVPPVREWLAMADPRVGKSFVDKDLHAYLRLENFKLLRNHTQLLRQPSDKSHYGNRLLPAPPT